MKRAATLVAVGWLSACGVAQESAPERKRQPPTVAERRMPTMPRAVALALPAQADDFVELQALRGESRLAFRWRGAEPVAGEADEHGRRYPAAVHGGAAWLRPLLDGVEDRVEVHHGDRVIYDLVVDGLARVERSADQLAFQDEGGATRFLIDRAKVVDAVGEERAATMTLSDCVGAERLAGLTDRRCTLTVAWDSEGLRYPVLLDPTWSATLIAPYAFDQHAAVTLPSGEVFVMNGAGAAIYETNTSKGFVPLSLHSDALRDGATVTAFADKILIAGGSVTGVPVATTCIFSQTQLEMAKVSQTITPPPAPCSPSGPLVTLRSSHSATLVGNQIVFIGGGTPPTFVGKLDTQAPQLGSVATTIPDLPRIMHEGIAMPNGDVLVVGGFVPSVCDPARVRRFTPTGFTVAYVPAGDRIRQAAVEAGGGVFLLGGATAAIGCGPTSSIANLLFFDPATDTTTSGPPMIVPRDQHAAVVMVDDSLLVTGGLDGQQVYANSHLYSYDPTAPEAGAWTPYAPLSVGLVSAKTVRLADGSVLLVGGLQCSGPTSCTPSNRAYLLQALPLGAPCSLNAECGTGHCADGRCCDSACDAFCTACSAAQKGGGSDGTCGPVGVSLPDPKGTCVDLGAPACSTTGLCDGLGACAIYDGATACTSAVCTGDTLTVGLCAGPGTCTLMPSDCGAYTCDDGADACLASCVTIDDCASGHHCDDGTCVAQLADGETCTGDAACSSGFCVDGSCCNVRCGGQCERCEQGTCVAQTGEAPPGKPACPAAATGDPCSARLCDGTTREECVGYVGAEMRCGDATCRSENEALAAPLCDGFGQCRELGVQSCGLLDCRDGACLVDCASDEDCVAEATCGDGVCSVVPICVTSGLARAPDGTEVACFPFRCEGGACLDVCRSSDDCAAERACDPSGQCVSPPPPTADAGCSIERPGGVRSMPWWLLLGLVAARRRRRGANMSPITR